MKKLTSLLLVLAMLLTLAACNDSSKDPPPDNGPQGGQSDTGPGSDPNAGGGKKYDIAVVPWAMFEEFGVDVVNGAQYAADELGINLINPDANGDMQKEISIIEDLIQQQVDAVVIAPVDAEAIGPYVDMMVEAGIVVVDYDIETEAYCHAKVMSDHYAGGQASGEEFLKVHGDQGTVLIIDDVPGVTTAELRNAGFEDYLTEHAPDIKIIHQLSTGTRDTHRATIENMLEAYPEITGMFCFMGDIAIPAYNVCKTLGRTDIIIAGYDATPEQVEIMRQDGADCNLVCSLALYPKNIGRVAMLTAYQLLEGELEAGAYVSTANGMLTPANADTFEDLLVAE